MIIKAVQSESVKLNSIIVQLDSRLTEEIETIKAMGVVANPGSTVNNKWGNPNPTISSEKPSSVSSNSNKSDSHTHVKKGETLNSVTD